MTDPDFKPADPTNGINRTQAGAPWPMLVAINSLNLGILIVDSECRITFANDYATKLLRSLNGARSRIQAADRIGGANSFDRRVREAITDSDDGAASFLALNSAGANSLVVQIMPYKIEGLGQASASGSVLFVSDVSTKPDLNLAPIAKLYGLTRAELRLLEALLNGEKVGNYAQKSGVTLNTIKGHLAQLFRKTQTCRQTELVLCVLANPYSG